MITVFCVNTGDNIEVEGGTTLLALGESLSSRLPFIPICAHVNNKTENLSYSIYAPKSIEFLPAESASGKRVYIRSLCMMLYRALCGALPSHRLRFEHSVAAGYYCRIFDEMDNPVIPSDELISELLDKMGELVRRDLPFIEHEAPTDEVIEVFRRQGLESKISLLETTSQLYTRYYTLDDVADSYYSALAPSCRHIRVFNLQKYKDGMLLSGPDPANTDIPAQPVTQEKMFKAFQEYLAFNRAIKVSNVGQLNRATENRDAAELINVAEALHEKYIGEIARRIAERNEKEMARVVLLAGPSSSGKTTTTKRLAIHLMTNLKTPKMISLDDYFVDRDLTPKDESGDYDYESLYSLDLEQLNSDLRALLDGEEINLPTYSFELGRRIERKRPLRLKKDEVLLIEGIHGLNPELTREITRDEVFTVYVSALTSLNIDDHNWISTTDNRLLRRIVRDHKYRHTSALETIRRWPSVRRGEEKWIFPFQENADATFNSSLIFELAVMKDYAEPLLRRVPHNSPLYAEAHRLLKFLSFFEPIPADQVPTTSLLREFLGGSSFHY